jgi:hypothetical protein
MNPSPKGPTTDRLPLLVYGTLVGLIAWFVIAAWGFASAGYADLILVVVTGFFIVALGIPFILWRVARANRDPTATREKPVHFAEWASGTFETWQDRVRGANAATEIALPIAAAAVGMTALVIVFHYAAAHAPFVTSV